MAETIGEIVAWLRDPKIKNPMRKTWRDVLASRIEKAWKRERTEIEAQALSIGGIVEASRHKPFAHRETPNTVHNPVSVPQMVGNAAAMYNALVQVQDRLVASVYDGKIDPHETLKIVETALAEPPRECDVGYVEDQIQRYSEFCRNHKKLKAPPIHSLEWAQRPYEGGAR